MALWSLVLMTLIGTPVAPILANYGDYSNPDFGGSFVEESTVPLPTGPAFEFLGRTTPTVIDSNGQLVNDSNRNNIADPGETFYTPPTPTNDNGKQLVNYANQLGKDETYSVLISFGGWVAGWGGSAFELAFSNFILKLGCYFTTVGGSSCDAGAGGAAIFGGQGQVGGIVNEMWSLIRDLFNLTLIFSLIYIGFRMILDADDGATKKALGGVIIAALLVNFSLYIAKLVVDITNFTAVQIYNEMLVNPVGNFVVAGEDTDGDGVADSAGDFSLQSDNNMASAFMQVLKIGTWFDPDGGIISMSTTYALIAMLFLIFLGFVFLYGALMMIARFIAIIVLLIFSPAMFIGYVLPQFKSMSDTWWKRFVGYAAFAPVYVFFLYLSLYVLLQMSPGGDYASGFNKNGNFASDAMGIFVFYIVGVAFLLMSTKVSGYLANKGAGGTMNMANNWARKLTAGTAGVLATAPMGLVGKAATMGSEAIERRTGRSTMISRGLNYTGTSLKNQKVGGVSMASATGSAVKFVRGKERIEAGDKRARGLRDDADKKKKQKEAIATLADDTKVSEHEREIAKLGTSAVVAMAKDKDGEATLIKRAALLRPDQVKAIEDDKELDKAVIKRITEARTTALKKKYEPDGTEPAKGEISKAPVHELAVFSVEDLENENMAISLSEDKIDKLPEPKFIESDKTRIKEARKAAIIKVAYNGGVIKTRDGKNISKSDLLKAKPADIAKYPAEALEALGHEIPIPALSKVVQDGTINKTDQGKIRTAIDGFIQSKPNDPAAVAYKEWLKDSPLGKQLGK